MAKVFEVSRSGFHAWLKRPPSKHRQENQRLKVAIRAAHEINRRTYGAERLHKELQEEGFVTGRDRVVRLRQGMGIQRKHRATLKSLRKRTMIPYPFVKDYSVLHQILL
jgi:hypothetical protein